MEPTSLPDEVAEVVEPGGHTRRNFISGIAAAGASTAAAVALDRAGVLDLATDTAQAASPNSFSDFTAIAASAEDVLRVPDGFRADILIKYGDTFANTDGTELTYGYNNDFLAFFPLPAGSTNANEGLLFVNHEYPAPAFQHGQPVAADKTVEQIEIERESVGNSILHVKRGGDGVWKIVSPSPYNRRVTGAAPELRFTGPLADNPAYPGIGASVTGSVANCSGGITPWGTALSCEENYSDYGVDTPPFGYGWTEAKLATNQYVNGDGSDVASPAKYGWVVEHDPYATELAPGQAGRKHTALGRFRHENTAFRARPGKPFVLYMGDDIAGGGVYKFVSTRSYDPGNREENLKILTEGTLYIARWEPEGRRRFGPGGTPLLTSETGTGWWREVTEAELVDTLPRITASVDGVTPGDYNAHYATNRPEDVEVDEDGTVYIALTNNSGVNDLHGSIRRVREAGNDATAVGPTKQFIWEDYAAGGPTGSSQPGQEGFSSPDNLVFDKAGNLWVVTDISSSSLNVGVREFHKNNALFMVPRSGPNAGVAFRFASMPTRAEGTGPYFTPDEETLWVNVQHPGEDTPPDDPGSYWPLGNKTLEQNPGIPIPATVAITRVLPKQDPGTPVIPPPVTPTPPDITKPDVDHVSSQLRKLSQLRKGGTRFTFEVDEPGTLTVTLSARLRKAGKKDKGRGKSRRLARKSLTVAKAGEVSLRLRPSSALRVLLKRERELPATLKIEAVDAAGNRTARTVRLLFR